MRGEQTDLSRVKSLSNFLTSILNMLFYVMILAFWFTNEKERITEILIDQTHEERGLTIWIWGDVKLWHIHFIHLNCVCSVLYDVARTTCTHTWNAEYNPVSNVEMKWQQSSENKTNWISEMKLKPLIMNFVFFSPIVLSRMQWLVYGLQRTYGHFVMTYPNKISIYDCLFSHLINVNDSNRCI